MQRLVTVITPTTRDREEFNKRIAQIIHSQTYQNIEHLWDYSGLSVGAKRNNLCEQAKGEIILHADSDDWYQNDWVAKSVAHLLVNNCDITGLQDAYFMRGDERWKYTYKMQRPWVMGATMCYTKAWWERNRYRNINAGEDTHIQWDNKSIIVPHTYIDGFMSSIHPGNTCPRSLKDKEWSRIS